MELQGILDEIALAVQVHRGLGKVADYIPALARVAPDRFGMALCTVDGEVISTGDAAEPFSIQSISKVFTLMLALSRVGNELWTRMSKEPSGDPFNSMVLLEREKGIPRNPFINAGALVVVDVLLDSETTPHIVLRDYLRVLSGNHDIQFDAEVAQSELDHAHTNLALAHLIRSHGNLHHAVDRVIHSYCHQCALAMSCIDLARAALPLAAAGHSAIIDESVLTEKRARRINALMLTSGTYDSVGSFAFRVGLPAKSGVGGGIVAVIPGSMSLCVWSPELDRSGNSYLGTAALELFASMTRLSIL